MLASQTVNATTAMQPVLFCAHGSPMNIIEQSDYSQEMQKLSQQLKQPKAVLIITPHWIQNSFTISSNNKQIYDFYGFCDELYQVKYTPQTDKKLAQNIAKELNISYDENRGFDHGCWAVAMKLFPNGDVPIIQMSISKNATFYDYISLGKKMQYLREQNILVVASGNFTHNLREIEFAHSKTHTWAKECEESICKNIAEKNIQNLCEPYENIANFAKAHPSADHYMPLLIALGAIKDNEAIQTIRPQIQNASISMACFLSVV